VRRGLWCGTVGGGGRYLHPPLWGSWGYSLGTWGHPRDVPGLSRERREPGEKAAAMGDGAEKERGGGGRGGGGQLDMSSHGLRVPPPPRFSPAQSPSRGRQKDSSSAVSAHENCSPHPWAHGWWDRDLLVPWARSPAARRDASSSPSTQLFPAAHPGTGQTLCRPRGSRSRHARVAPSSTHPRRSIPDGADHAQPLSHARPGPEGSVGVPGPGDRLPAPRSLPRHPLGLPALFRASHKQTAEMGEATWQHRSARCSQPRQPPPQPQLRPWVASSLN